MKAVAALVAVLTIGVAPPAAAQRRAAPETRKAGWDAIRANRLLEAAELFREAMRLDPGDAGVMLGAGLTAHLLGRSDEARQHLTAALQMEPSLTEASLLLGQILHREGDLAGAIHAYEQALSHAPHETILRARLDTWRREMALHESFKQRVGHRFTVFFEGPNEEALATRALELLDAAYWRIGTALGIYPATAITVVLYTNEQFRDVTRSPSWAAAAFDGRIRIPIRGALGNEKELERVLAHEFTHALVHSVAPRGVPQWLNEGLAQFFESGSEEPPGLTSDSVPTTDNTLQQESMSLQRLEWSFDGLSREEAKLAYERSASAVRALVDQAGLTGVANLLAYLGQGLPFEEAFERAAFTSYGEFSRGFPERKAYR